MYVGGWGMKVCRVDVGLLICHPCFLSQACRHEFFCLGLGYKEETDPKYCTGDYCLSEAECMNVMTCKMKFVPELTGTKQMRKTQFVPSSAKPAYMCRVMAANQCGHVYCHGCFQELRVKYEKANEGQRPKRKRG